MDKQVKVIDLSVHNGFADWETLRKEGVFLSIHRLCLGWKYRDPAYRWHAQQEWFDKGLHGIYHVHVPGQDPLWQAEIQAANTPYSSGPIWLDVEIPHHMTRRQASHRLWKHLISLEGLTRRRVGIYTRRSFWNVYYEPGAYPWDTRPLWVAHYTDASEPLLPDPWDRWILWQYSKTGLFAGIEGDVDLDRLSVSWADYDDLRLVRPQDLSADH